MFDLGWSKILILAAVAIVVVGPKELPTLLRTLGQFIAQLRRHAADFRAQFDEAMRSTELDQIKRDVEAIKTDAHASIRGIGQSLEQEVNASKASIEQTMQTADAQFKPAVEPPAAVSEPVASSAGLPETSSPASPTIEPAVLPRFDPVPTPEPVKTGA